MSDPPRTPGARRRILLVEGDAALRRALTFSLGIEGYEVDGMDCGQALLDLAFEGAVIIVIDQHLPDLSGVECLTRLRERGVTPPAILIATGLSRNLAARAEELGATVLLNPILGDDLIAALRGLGA